MQNRQAITLGQAGQTRKFIARDSLATQTSWAAALGEDVVKMVEALPDTLAGKRDRALLLIGFGAALRRSELVALDVADVTVTERGLVVRVKRSKTDQEGEGADIAIARSRADESCSYPGSTHPQTDCQPPSCLRSASTR